MALILETETKTLNTIALRGIVVFPKTVSSFEIGRKMSINALKNAQSADEPLFLVTQKDAAVSEPKASDLMNTGVVAKILHTKRLNDGAIQVVVEGIRRADRGETFISDDLISCEIINRKARRTSTFTEERASVKELFEIFTEYLNFVSKPSEDIIEDVNKLRDPSHIVDFLTNHFVVNIDERMDLLEEYDTVKRIHMLCDIFEKDIEIFKLDNSIHQRVRQTLQKQQRDMYLREQLRAIKTELGEYEGVDESDDSDEYSAKIKEAKLPLDIEEKLLAENAKLMKMPFGTPEATVIRNYIETCLELPWGKKSNDRNDIKLARKILDKDHDGIEKVKERIIEFISVKQLKPNLKGQILCFVGPPGVGKTSIAKSIARATNREFALPLRVNLISDHENGGGSR